MKRAVCTVLAVIMLLASCSGGNGVRIVPYPHNLDTESLQKVYDSALYGFDISQKPLCVGFADYVFIATVKSLDEVKYSGKTEDSVVYSVSTLVTIQVEENIKGALKTEEPITMWLLGGPSKDNKKIIIRDGHRLPEPGETYVYLACALEGGDITNIGGGGICLIGSRTEDGEEFYARYEKALADYRDAYEHQDTTYYIDWGYPSRYDVNYKGE